MEGFPVPPMYRVTQEFPLPEIEDVPAAISAEIDSLNIPASIRSGDTVAITAGSRSITDMVPALRTVIGSLRAMGASPFIVPAMGSHGGGTAEGQSALLARYNISEVSLGCPVRSSMEVVSLGMTGAGFPVLFDRHAYEADHVVIVNRVKPHTRFSAPIESGLVKMCLVGLGKAEGARIYHRAIDRLGWRETYGQSFAIVSKKVRLLIGLALVENARKKTGAVAALRPDRFPVEEPLLLARARDMMATVPVKDIDLLIVDEMGKDISGTGMDTNVTGRKDGLSPIARRIFVRDLSDRAGGNALGIGLADFTTRRLVEKIDHHATYLNARTAYRIDACKIPMTFDADLDALETAAFMCGVDDMAAFRIVWIKNTLELGTFLVSEACLHDLRKNRLLTIDPDPLPVSVDSARNLFPPDRA
jgi:hypothetical protein